MTREQIRAAAINAANEVYDREECIEWEHLVFAFRDGAEWRINSVWHDNSVRPSEDCDVLVETKHRIIFDRYDTDYNELDSGTDWEMEVIRWAYASDLLPERKEGNNV